jgi:methionyl-tRNA synthetase
LSGFLSDPIPGAFKTISIETGSQVEWIEEENYMFRLGTFKDDLLSYYRSHPRSVYPEQYREDTLKMLGDGQDASFTLADISISRPRSRLEWGIQVPDDPLQSTSDMGWWPADLQIIGKDILRFHAIYLPAVLLALSAHPYPTKSQPSLNGLPLSTTILTHAHWTSSQKKMSKSLGNVADPLEAIEKWGVDTVRFYLMRVGGRWKDDVGENLNLKLSFIAVTSVDRLVPFSARQAPQRDSSTAGQLFLADHLSSSC